MFGIGFTELLLIAIIAILFLGPDKLPQAMVDMAKLIKSIKQTVGEAKSSLEEEINIADLKQEAMRYKKQLTEVSDELRGFKHLSIEEFDETFVSSKETSGMTPAQKHPEQVEMKAKSAALSGDDKPKHEHEKIKTQPKRPDSYTQPNTTPKGSIEEKESTSKDA